MTYGQVAAAAGSPRAARQVGGVLRVCDGEHVPWWRVLNAAGVISIKGNIYATPILQKQLLEAEGVAVSAQYMVNLRQCQYYPKRFGGT